MRADATMDRMSTAGGRGRPRRPALFGPTVMDTFVGEPDPAQRIEAAHTTAAALVSHGRRSADPRETARLVALADDQGLDAIAQLWADRPADTLPGALWRLFALRAGILADPAAYAAAFDAGRHRAPVDEVVAGVGQPLGVDEVRLLADRVLSGAFDADLAVALERAGAFCRVVATGWALQADDEDEASATATTRKAADLARTGTQLVAAAGLWRAGALL